MKKLLGKLIDRFSHPVELDICILSYPKSGRTWLKVLVGKYLSLKYNLPESKILSTEFMTSKSGLPRVSFGHNGTGTDNATPLTRKLAYDKRNYANKKVVLLGRNFKDTLVSAYFQATKRDNVFGGTISEFIRTELFGIQKIIKFYDGWLHNRHVPNSFLFIQYEELHQDPKTALKKLLSFIGEAEVEESLLDESIEYCSFSKLKKLEAENRFKNTILCPKNAADPESFKVRKGKVGGYAEYLSEEDIRFIDNTIKEHHFDVAEFYAPSTL